MEQLPVVTLMKLKNTVERILHVRGNYQGGILEMSVIVDNNLSKEVVETVLPKLLHALKLQGEIFRNVRFNYGIWQEDEVIKNQVCPMMAAISAGFYEEYQQKERAKHLGALVKYLKLFHARSKLILVLTDERCQIEENVKSEMRPFLDKKLMLIKINEEKDIKIQYREF